MSTEHQLLSAFHIKCWGTCRGNRRSQRKDSHSANTCKRWSSPSWSPSPTSCLLTYPVFSNHFIQQQSKMSPYTYSPQKCVQEGKQKGIYNSSDFCSQPDVILTTKEKVVDTFSICLVHMMAAEICPSCFKDPGFAFLSLTSLGYTIWMFCLIQWNTQCKMHAG